MTTERTLAWGRAVRAAAVMAVDPHHVGIDVRAGVGPVRDAWLAVLRDLAACAIRKLPPSIDGSRLLGGLDLAATLAGRRAVASPGLLAESDGGILLAVMAERMPPATATHLASALDLGAVRIEREGMSREAVARFGLVTLDEGEADDEHTAAALRDRLAIHLDLRAFAHRDVADGFTQEDLAQLRADIATAREIFARVGVDDETIAALCGAAVALGMDSARAPLHAVRVARILAALDGRDFVGEDDAREAAALVLAPRATQLPAPPQEAQDDASRNETPQDETPQDAQDDPRDAERPQTLPENVRPLDDVVLDAASAALPSGLLARLAAGHAAPRSQAMSGKAGDARATTQRGKRLGSRAGMPRGGQRLDLVATLRAAAPWQKMRAATASSGRIVIRPEDLRIARYEENARTTTIFLVDASGSAARERLAEAKGAVRLMLAECYIRRDEVALMAFRGASADLRLPPTRSLVRAERALAALPGGGGTPLATALDAATLLAGGEARKGRTPTLVLMSDGRANVARDGAGGRPRAHADAVLAAQGWRLGGCAAVFIDTSAAPNPLAAEIAAQMGARYVPLPFADARGIDAALRASAR